MHVSFNFRTRFLFFCSLAMWLCGWQSIAIATPVQDRGKDGPATIPFAPATTDEKDDAANKEKANAAEKVNKLAELKFEEIEKLRKQADDWIVQLGSDKFKRREAAQERLIEIAQLVRDKLETAQKNKDFEIAGRAKKILSLIAKPNFTVTDALGNPIPFAKLVAFVQWREKHAVPFRTGPKLDPLLRRSKTSTYADAMGRFTLPEDILADVSIVVSHPRFGSGRIAFKIPARNKTLRVPLVDRESMAYSRCLKGVVNDSTGKPISEASITGSTVRTPGEGLINGNYPFGEALTGSDGKFSFYLPNKPSKERGDLIPPNSNYQIQVSLPGDSMNVPVSGVYNNSEQAKIVFSLDQRVHRFVFETLDGGDAEAGSLARNYTLQYRRMHEGRVTHSRLKIETANKGMKLIPGTYVAQAIVKGRHINMVPIEVNRSSPEVLRFKFPPEVKFHGRVVHGVTGKPIEGVFVVGYSASGSATSATLTKEQWQALRLLEPDAPLDSPAIEHLKKVKRIMGFTRTGKDGFFTLIQPRGSQFYGVLALAEDFVPFTIPHFALMPSRKNEMQAGDKKPIDEEGPLERDYTLFPAAKLVFKSTTHPKVRATPRWIIDEKEAGQPIWLKRFFDTTKETGGWFEKGDWLKMETPQAISVPAGLKVRLNLITSSRHGLSRYVYPQTLQLKPGEVLALDDIKFRSTLKAEVIVVDDNGNSVEGVPVRRLQIEENAWSVAHNTNREGKVTFGLNPNSKGKFRVGQVIRTSEDSATIAIDFAVGETAPEKPFRIILTAAQIKKILRR